MCENLSKINETSRKAMDMFSEIVGHESPDEVYIFPPVNQRVDIPDISIPPRAVISNSIKEWLEELLSSSSNIEILAESSSDALEKGDEDLRIRGMIAEERESMKKYTELTVPIMFLKRFLKVSHENLFFLTSFFFFSYLYRTIILCSLFTLLTRPCPIEAKDPTLKSTCKIHKPQNSKRNIAKCQRKLLKKN
jgi:hypothetical protein